MGSLIGKLMNLRAEVLGVFSVKGTLRAAVAVQRDAGVVYWIDDADNSRVLKTQWIRLLSGSLTEETDGTLFLELARRGYNLEKLRKELTIETAEIVNIAEQAEHTDDRPTAS